MVGYARAGATAREWRRPTSSLSFPTHQLTPVALTSLNCVLRATTPRSTSLNWA
jgi:hypothetical protein